MAVRCPEFDIAYFLDGHNIGAALILAAAAGIITLIVRVGAEPEENGKVSQKTVQQRAPDKFRMLPPNKNNLQARFQTEHAAP